MRQALIPGKPIALWIRVFGPSGMREMQALLDTGAAWVTIPPHEAVYLGYDLGSAPRRKVLGATGVVLAPTIMLPRVSLGELDASDVPALCLDLPGGLIPALLGMSMISRFNVTLDATHRELRISAP